MSLLRDFPLACVENSPQQWQTSSFTITELKTTAVNSGQAFWHEEGRLVSAPLAPLLCRSECLYPVCAGLSRSHLCEALSSTSKQSSPVTPTQRQTPQWPVTSSQCHTNCTVACTVTSLRWTTPLTSAEGPNFPLQPSLLQPRGTCGWKTTAAKFYGCIPRGVDNVFNTVLVYINT